MLRCSTTIVHVALRFVVMLISVGCLPFRADHELSVSNITRTNENLFVNGSKYVKHPHDNDSRIRILNHGNVNTEGVAGEDGEQDIIFPDRYQVVFEPIPKIDGPPLCAEDGTFCEEFASYPYQHVRETLKRTRLRNALFGTDEAPAVVNRIGQDEDEGFVCEAVERTIFPKIAKNKQDEWKYIINQGDTEGYVQGVKVETCARKNAPCAVLGNPPIGYVMSCKQKYMFRRLMSLTTGGEPTADSFQLPSACCCSYKRTTGFLARFGLERSQSKRTGR